MTQFHRVVMLQTSVPKPPFLEKLEFSGGESFIKGRLIRERSAALFPKEEALLSVYKNAAARRPLRLCLPPSLAYCLFKFYRRVAFSSSAPSPVSCENGIMPVLLCNSSPIIDLFTGAPFLARSQRCSFKIIIIIHSV